MAIYGKLVDHKGFPDFFLVIYALYEKINISGGGNFTYGYRVYRDHRSIFEARVFVKPLHGEV